MAAAPGADSAPGVRKNGLCVQHCQLIQAHLGLAGDPLQSLLSPKLQKPEIEEQEEQKEVGKGKC